MYCCGTSHLIDWCHLYSLYRGFAIKLIITLLIFLLLDPKHPRLLVKFLTRNVLALCVRVPFYWRAAYPVLLCLLSYRACWAVVCCVAVVAVEAFASLPPLGGESPFLSIRVSLCDNA